MWKQCIIFNKTIDNYILNIMLFPNIKCPGSLDEQFRLNGEIYRNLLVGTVSVIDGRLVISTFDVCDIDFNITNVDDVVNHATFRLFRRFEVPTYTLFGFNSHSLTPSLPLSLYLSHHLSLSLTALSIALTRVPFAHLN